MKKLIATFIGGGVLGFIAGAGLMLIIFPFLFPPAPVDINGNGAELITQCPGRMPRHWQKLKTYRSADGFAAQPSARKIFMPMNRA